MMLRVVIASWILCYRLCFCHHILVSGVTASYGHWNTLLHISKELLNKKNHFLTFVIDEQYDYYLNTITNDEVLNNNNKESYQIFYTPNEQQIDFKKFQENNIQIHDGLIKQAAISFIPKAIFLNNSQQSQSSTNTNISNLELLINYNLKSKHNNISLLKFNLKIDFCLLDAFNFFDIILCSKMFNIPTIIYMFPAILSKSEYYYIRNTYLYFLDPFSLDSYFPDMTNGTIMTYQQKWITFLTNIMYLINQKFTSYFIIKQILYEFNSLLSRLNINKSFDINIYNNGFSDFWDECIIISSLGIQFTPISYKRPRIKQFGFLLHTNASNASNQIIKDKELLSWIEMDKNKPILLISMGSIHLLPQQIKQTIYKQLIKHSAENNYRVLWALRQNINLNANQTNDKLETEYFKIMNTYIEQFEILSHPSIKLFMTHCGTGGIMEAIYNKKLMILYPMLADQHMNGKRAQDIGVGILIKDRENMSDLTTIIDTLMLNETYSLYYEKQMNKAYEMILYNGGVSDAVKFIEFVIEFGSKQFLCTYGHNYNCNEAVFPWYQETMIDIYLISALMLLLFTIFIKKCCIDCFFNCKGNKVSNRKHKLE